MNWEKLTEENLILKEGDQVKGRVNRTRGNYGWEAMVLDACGCVCAYQLFPVVESEELGQTNAKSFTEEWAERTVEKARPLRDDDFGEI